VCICSCDREGASIPRLGSGGVGLKILLRVYVCVCNFARGIIFPGRDRQTVRQNKHVLEKEQKENQFSYENCACASQRRFRFFLLPFSSHNSLRVRMLLQINVRELYKSEGYGVALASRIDKFIGLF